MGEHSHALPHNYYRDPAEVVEQLELKALGCRLCVKHQEVLDRVVCGDSRKGAPRIGVGCRWFIEGG